MMTVFDALLLAVLGVSIFFAAVRGAIRELATMAALGAGGVAAWAGLKPALALLGKEGSFFATVIIAGALALIAFLGAYFLLHKATLRVSLSEPMRKADRIGGGIFGLVRALVLIGLGFLGYGYYLDEKNQPDAVKQALLLPLATSSAQFFEQFAPNARELESAAEATADAAKDGYDQADRSGLREIVTTVTTSDTDTKPADPIADILTKETSSDGQPNQQ